MTVRSQSSDEKVMDAKDGSLSTTADSLLPVLIENYNCKTEELPSSVSY